LSLPLKRLRTNFGFEFFKSLSETAVHFASARNSLDFLQQSEGIENIGKGLMQTASGKYFCKKLILILCWGWIMDSCLQIGYWLYSPIDMKTLKKITNKKQLTTDSSN
jgi:hypothetical protein